MRSLREDFATLPDGTRLFYRVTGEPGPGPDLVLLDGVGCEGFVWRHLAPRWARRRRVLHLNYRGHGRSEVPRGYAGLTVEDAADDVAFLVEREGLQRPVVAGHSMGCQVALELHRRHARHVSGLLLFCGSHGRPLDTFHDAGTLKAVFPWARRAVERWPSLTRALTGSLLPTELAFQVSARVELNPDWVRREDFMPYLHHLSVMDPVVFVRMLDAAGRHTAQDHLPHVDVPALVVAAERDRFTPMRLSVEMAERIPGAELLVVRGGSHAAPIEQSELCLLRTERFLRERVERRAEAPGAATG